jgi:secretion/DNA translocation related TadE-like protein
MAAPARGREAGAGTVLALGLGLVLLLAMIAAVLLGQAAVLASKAAAAADLAALAAADAARGLTAGEPCGVAAAVAGRHGARLLACAVEAGDTVQVRTELDVRTPFGPASGLARAGPPPAQGAGRNPAGQRMELARRGGSPGGLLPGRCSAGHRRPWRRWRRSVASPAA